MGILNNPIDQRCAMFCSAAIEMCEQQKDMNPQRMALGALRSLLHSAIQHDLLHPEQIMVHSSSAILLQAIANVVLENMDWGTFNNRLNIEKATLDVLGPSS